MGRLKGAAARWSPDDMEQDWVPLAPERVCEVAYDQLDRDRFRHPARFRRWRPDRDPGSCLLAQLEPQEPGLAVAVAPALLPHLAGRPLTLGRFPGGVEGPGFAQTECRGRPTWMATAPIRLRSGELRRYCVANDRPSLAWIANLGAIELHAFLARDRLEEPSVVAFDVDPGPGTGLLECCATALRLRGVLAEEGLASVAKTSGSVGVHVYVPLNTPHRYPEAKAFARAVAGRLASERPRHVSDSQSREMRSGRVLVDWLQNDERRTMVSPYSLRATPRPAVSTPVAWEEIEAALRSGDPSSLAFSPRDVLARVERGGDLFRPVLETRQALPDAAGLIDG